MVDPQLFVSSCSRHWWGSRGGFRQRTALVRLVPLLFTLAFLAACFGAFWLGRFGA